MKIFTAKYLFDGERLLENMAVVISNNTVVDIDSTDIIKKIYNTLELKDFGEGVLFPGFVNLHTHLELSYLKSRLPIKRGFVEWLKKIILTKKEHVDKDNIEKAMQYGIEELYKSGVRVVGDISNTLASCPFLEQAMPKSTVFFENYGLKKEKACEAKENLNMIMEINAKKYKKITIAPAAHSVYSTNGCLIDCTANFDSRLPFSMHFLESRYEKDFLLSKGELFEMLNNFGLIDERLNYKSIFDYMNSVAALRENTIFVHCVYADENELKKIKRLNSTVCLCLRSNDYISGRFPNVYAVEKSRVNIGIGTDSLASNWSLNFLDELRFIYKNFNRLNPENIFKWSVSGGANALGLNMGFKKGYLAYDFFYKTKTNSPLAEILE